MTSPDSRTVRGRRAQRELASLGVVTLFGFFMMGFPVVRFTSPAANFAFGCAVFTLPVFAPILVLRLDAERLPRILAALALTPLVGFSLFVALLTGSCLQDIRAAGVDASFKPVAVLPLSGSHLTAYRTNGGATTDFGIVVRHEMRVLPGVLLVRDVFDEYHAADASLRLVGPDRVEVRTAHRGTVVQLRRFVYF